MPRKGSVDRGLFQREGVWWIRWTCPYGHDHRQPIGTAKSIARTEYHKRKLAVKTEGYCLTEAQAKAAREKPVLLQDAAKEYLAWAARERPRSVTFREKALKHLLAAFSSRPLKDITGEQVDAYIHARRDAGAAPGTINRERTVLGHLFSKALKKGTAADNPVKQTEKLREPDGTPRPLTYDEQARLLAVLPRHYLPFVKLALHTGLRLGELRAQTWKDIDLAHSVLTVTRPKSGKPESLHLTATAKGLLASLERTGPLLFPTMPTRLTTLFTRYTKKVGLPDVTFHCLRDTFISRLAPHTSVPSLMQLARHRDYRTTRRYVKVDDATLKAALAHLDENETGTHTGTEKTAVAELLDSLGIAS
ncbi:MAG: site-specific integrase [bacterium]|uniref:Site-specific integrase n=1 Tax=Candidatus Methylomirabilis tolerans TaxID=3123416 RepID=A0AAJ1AKD7_9BACT|nr:site-specific integrase [Candidatus Methylomirabilis sp.]